MAITACPLMRPRCARNPNKATAHVPIQRPDTYQRLPRTCKTSLANSSRFIHLGSDQSFAASCPNVRSIGGNLTQERGWTERAWCFRVLFSCAWCGVCNTVDWVGRNVAGFDTINPNGVVSLCGLRYYPQQEPPSWIGGQATVPYEQYTQQSPANGFSTSPQEVHS
jgi:hypothetical protein